MSMNDCDSVQTVLSRADELYQRGRCDAAVDVLMAGVEEHSQEDELVYGLAEMLIDSERFASALQVLRRMPDGRKNLKQRALIGTCLEGLEQYHEAELMVDDLLRVAPDFTVAINLKGVLAYRKGNQRAATALFQRAANRDPSYWEPYANLATLMWEQDQTAALDLYEKAFTCKPTARQSTITYHAAAQSAGASSRAELAFYAAKERYPNNRRIHFLLIDLLIRQEKYHQAMDLTEAAMAQFDIDDGIVAAALSIRARMGPHHPKAETAQRAAVSLCMIARDEESHLARCLQNIKSLVDEMIIVDTGSNDRTKDIGRAFGARVYDMDWRDDFAAARNFSLSKASGDWILVLDADEVISAQDHSRFKALLQKANGRPMGFSVVTRNYTHRANTVGVVFNDGGYPDEEAGLGWFPSEKVRLFKNDSAIRFRYPVHEIVEPSLERAGISIEPFDIPIHHYGKLDEALNIRKAEAYYRIGRAKLHELGDCPPALRELAVQAGNLEKFEEAIELWQQVIALTPDMAEAHVNLGTALWNLHNYPDALRAAQTAVDLDPDLKEARFNCAMNLLLLARVVEAIGILQHLIAVEPQYLPARFLLGVALCCYGRREEGRDIFAAIQQQLPALSLQVSLREMADRLHAAGCSDYANQLMKIAGLIG
jgi:tetratricopeptide (TPR) repeat protein